MPLNQIAVGIGASANFVYVFLDNIELRKINVNQIKPDKTFTVSYGVPGVRKGL